MAVDELANPASLDLLDTRDQLGDRDSALGEIIRHRVERKSRSLVSSRCPQPLWRQTCVYPATLRSAQLQVVRTLDVRSFSASGAA